MSKQVPQRASIPRQTADFLEQEIHKERWSRTIPGERSLCSLLGISRPTLKLALEILTRREILLAPEQGKSRSIDPKLPAQNSSEKHLFILNFHHRKNYDPPGKNVIDNLSQRLYQKGWSIETTHCEINNTSELIERLDLLKTGRSRARWLLISPQPDAVKWAEQNKVRSVAMGGAVLQSTFPSIGTPIKQLTKQACQRLLSLGHTRIITLIPNNRSSLINDLSINIGSVFKTFGAIFSQNYSLPELAPGVTELWDQLEKSFKITPPTALIVDGFHEYSTVLSFCLEKGLRIPQDLSVIILSHNHDDLQLRPKPAHFLVPVEKMVNQLARWIEDYPTGTVGNKQLDLDFNPCGSLAKPNT